MATVGGIEIVSHDLRSAPDQVLDALHELDAAFEKESRPDEPPTPCETRKARWRSMPNYKDAIVWLATEDDEPIASAFLDIDRTGDNAHIGEMWVMVSAARRRQGLARVLLEPIVETADIEKRTLLLTFTEASVPSGGAFAQRLGAEAGLVERESELDLTRLDRALVSRWNEEGPTRAPDHELLFVEQGLPEELLDPFTRLYDVTNSAPRESLAVEDRHMTPQQLRERERTYAESGGQRILCIARQRSSGELAGFTELGWHPGEPWKMHQFWTAVHPDHRGRALGKWLKAANLQLAMERWPAATKVVTGNAFSNDAMIGINDELGFRETSAWTVWQVPVDDVRGYLTRN